MKRKIASLTATFKTAAAFGAKYAVDFPATSTGGQQFALVTAAVPQTATLGAAQVSGTESAHAGVLFKVAGRFHLHADLHGIADAAHSLALLGTAGLQGKFLMPRSGGDQALLDTARAFQTDAPAFSTQFISLGLPANFIAQLGTDIAGPLRRPSRPRARAWVCRPGPPADWKTRPTRPPWPCTSSKPSCPTRIKTTRPSSPNGRPPATSKNTRPSRARQPSPKSPPKPPPGTIRRRRRRNNSKRHGRGIFVVLHSVGITSSVGAAVKSKGIKSFSPG